MSTGLPEARVSGHTDLPLAGRWLTICAACMKARSQYRMPSQGAHRILIIVSGRQRDQMASAMAFWCWWYASLKLIGRPLAVA